MISDLDDLVGWRHYLHRHPELSHKETETAAAVESFLRHCHPHRLITRLGGYGVAAVFKGEKRGKSILLRCDLDALPIRETNDLEYQSVTPGVSHKCGHDGHMVIMLGVARELYRSGLAAGEVILLFQPAEERGEGALKVLEDPKFKDIQPDLVFALHNLPGFPRGNIIIRKKEFASASVGMEIKLFGKTSHAGEPDKGINPSTAVAGIIERFNSLGQNQKFQATAFITIVHVLLGEIAYGTSAGYAEIRATLRAHRNPDMKKLGDMARQLVKKIASAENLKPGIKMVEDFPAAVNHPFCTRLVEEAARKAELGVTRISEPFSWSEDFSQFLLRYPGCLFGLGSGEDHPKLHNPDYDFPDEIIPRGIAVYLQILRNTIGVDP